MTADNPAAPPAETESGEQPSFNWGRALDVAGVVAGIALAVIVADILTDGKVISRRLQQRRPREDETSDPD